MIANNNLLIYDIDQLTRFRDEILYNRNYGNIPEDTNIEEQIFCLAITARTKYLPEEQKNQYNMKNNIQFYKAIIREKDKFFKKLTERNLDTVTDRDGRILPLYIFAIYITINPRDEYQALFKLQKYCIDIAYRQDYRNMKLLDILAYKAYHTSPKKVNRAIIDFDITDMVTNKEQTIPELLKLLQPIKEGIFTIIETRGGFHIYMDLTKLNNQQKRYLFTELQKNYNQELFSEIKVETDAMVVPAGTLQGGFKVKFRDDIVNELIS